MLAAHVSGAFVHTTRYLSSFVPSTSVVSGVFTWCFYSAFSLPAMQSIIHSDLKVRVCGSPCASMHEYQAPHSQLSSICPSQCSTIRQQAGQTQRHTHKHACPCVPPHPQTDNVLLKLDKSSKLGVTLKVTDFGLAMNLDPGATHVSNFRGGTRFFIAPEVLSEGRAGRSADIYSLGVCAWWVGGFACAGVGRPADSCSPFINTTLEEKS